MLLKAHKIYNLVKSLKKTPFVIGPIELGNCLNLVEPESLLILKKAYEDIAQIYAQAGKPLPVNKDNLYKIIYHLNYVNARTRIEIFYLLNRRKNF